MDPANREGLETFMSITGASEMVAIQSLQAHNGDLNAAINFFFSDGAEALPQLQREDDDPNDWMEEDEPVATAAPFGSLPPPLSHWDNTEFSETERRNVPHSGVSPQVSFPAEVRNIPIDWGDGDSWPSNPLRGQSNMTIQEIVDDGPRDELQSNTASSVFRTAAELLRPRRFSGISYTGEDLDVGHNPHAPRIAEISVRVNEEGNDIEEEMLQAAIEASKKEAEEASQRGPPAHPQELAPVRISQGPPYLTARTAEDDDLARAVSLSLKTAEQEKAMRERGGPDSELAGVQNDENKPFIEHWRNRASPRRRGGSHEWTDTRGMYLGAPSSTNENERKKAVSSNAGLAVIGLQDKEEPHEQRPRTNKWTSSSEAVPIEQVSGQTQPQSFREQGDLLCASNSSAAEELGRTTGPIGDSFPSDEWGGISSEEHDEAVMLEAALFGGLPERTGLPYQSHRGIHNDAMDALAGVDGTSPTETYNRRVYPQPPSPSVVAQRLLREQQDDEYLASLAADREKEIRVMQEAEAQRLKEQEAAAVADAKEKLRRAEELKQLHAAEELERQLAAKKASLSQEPAGDDENAVTLLVRMPDGSRRGRRFYKSDKLQCLFDFIDVGGGVKPGSFRLVRQYPRVAFTDAEHGSSLLGLGLTSKQEVLFLELI